MARAIARINRNSGIGYGTAFAITPSLALTTFHCIGNKATGELRGVSFELQFPRWPVVADIEAADRFLDVALLRLREELPDYLTPLRIGPRPLADESFLAPGYPEQVAGVQDFTLSGRVVNPSARFSNDAPAMQLYCEQSASLVLAGASGAPVLIGEAQAVTGIINWNPPGPGGLAKGGTVYAVPIHDIGPLAEVMADLITSVDLERAGAAALVRTPLAAGGQFPEVRTLTPYELGAKYCGYSLRHDPYVMRDLDARIDEILASGSPILISGPPLAGKSRTAYEALVRILPRAQVIAPVNQQDSLVKLVSLLQDAMPTDEPVVLWLDDLDAMLATGAVTLRSLAEVKRQHPTLVIVATGPPDSSYQAPDLRYLTEILQAELPTMENVELAYYISPAECEAAERSYPDETFDDVGIGERLVAGPELWRRYSDTTKPHTRAIMCAAIDWRRSGRGGPVPQTVLSELYELYLAKQAPDADASSQAFNEALRHARSPVSSRIAMLTVATRSPDLSYAAMDYLVSREDSGRNRVPRPIPSATLECALRDSTQYEALSIGMRSRRSGLSAVETKAVEQAFSRLIPGYDDEEIFWFAFDKFRECDEYCHIIFERLNQTAADPDLRWRSAAILMLFENSAGRIEEAAPSAAYILQAAESGLNSFMAEPAGRVLMNASRYGEAVRAFRLAARQGGRWFERDEQGNETDLSLGEMSSRFKLAQSLVYLCAGQDIRAVENELREAEEQLVVVLRSRDPHWSDEARLLLAQLMFIRDAPGEAVAILDEMLESTNVRPGLLLQAGNQLTQQELTSAAEKFYRAVLGTDDTYTAAQASARLGMILFFEARYEEALPILNEALTLAAAQENYSAVATMIGIILRMRGELIAAKEKFESAIEVDQDPVWVGQARWGLALTLRDDDNWSRAATLVDEAVRNDTTGRSNIIAYLDGCDLKARGRIKEARRAFKRARDLGGENGAKAICQLASITYDKNPDKAVALLQSALTAKGEPGKMAHRWLGLVHLAARDYVNVAVALEPIVFSDSADIISAFALLYAYERLDHPRKNDAIEVVATLRVQAERTSDENVSAQERQVVDLLHKVHDPSESPLAHEIFIPCVVDSDNRGYRHQVPTAMLEQARTEPTLVRALCGWEWIPLRGAAAAGYSELPICPRCAEIEINKSDNGGYRHYAPTAMLEQARTEPTLVRALCGWEWIPLRGAAAAGYSELPICPRCVEIYERLPSR